MRFWASWLIVLALVALLDAVIEVLISGTIGLVVAQLPFDVALVLFLVALTRRRTRRRR